MSNNAPIIMAPTGELFSTTSPDCATPNLANSVKKNMLYHFLITKIYKRPSVKVGIKLNQSNLFNFF